MSFEMWLKKLDNIVSNEVGCGLDDLPDAPTRSYFDSGASPREAYEDFKYDWWDMEYLD